MNTTLVYDKCQYLTSDYQKHSVADIAEKDHSHRGQGKGHLQAVVEKATTSRYPGNNSANLGERWNISAYL